MPVPTISLPFDAATCKRDSTRLAFGKAVIELGAQKPDLVYLTADGAMPTGTGEFFKKYPDRAFNVGIAEQNLIGMAAGMASCGLPTVVGGYAPFLAYRPYEQVRNDIAYTKLNVVIGGVYSGISMATGGSTHHTTEDLAALRAVPNAIVITPADAREAHKATIAAVEHGGCVYIRLGGRTPEPVLYTGDYDFRIGKAVTLRDGKDLTIISTGAVTTYAALASDLLKKDGISVRVLNVHTVKPLDAEAIVKAAKETGRIMTVEEHNILGGLGGAVAEVVTSEHPVPVKRLGIKDIFASIGPLYGLHTKYGLTPDGIADSAREFLKK